MLKNRVPKINTCGMQVKWPCNDIEAHPQISKWLPRLPWQLQESVVVYESFLTFDAFFNRFLALYFEKLLIEKSLRLFMKKGIVATTPCYNVFLSGRNCGLSRHLKLHNAQLNLLSPSDVQCLGIKVKTRH